MSFSSLFSLILNGNSILVCACSLFFAVAASSAGTALVLPELTLEHIKP